MITAHHRPRWAWISLTCLLNVVGVAGCAPTSRPTPQEIRTLPRSLPEYYAAVKKRIDANWVSPRDADQAGQGTIAFVIRRNGTVKQIEITKTTGVHVLDAYARNAVLLAAPFPPFPDEVTTETLSLSMNFSYSPRPRFGAGEAP